VHHDIWDRDFPSEPALFTIERAGKTIDGIAQTTKQGYLYLFDRLTGEPLFPIHENPYPASTVPGEVTAATQPTPDAPAPFARQRLTEEMLTTRTKEAHDWAVKALRESRNNGQFYPFAVDKQTVVFPGFDGGAEWGGPAIDPVTDVLYVNANEMAWTGGLTAPMKGGNAGAQIYQKQCAVCHGADRSGSPPAFPSLVNLDSRLSEEQMANKIQNGVGRMPSFPNIKREELSALLNFLQTGNAQQAEPAKEMSAADESKDNEFAFTGYRKFLDPDGYPAIAPPWGTLNAIDLKTGKYLWRVPLGEYPELAAMGMKDTGS
jgi:quinoprotein glucose dehydrogenase